MLKQYYYGDGVKTQFGPCLKMTRVCQKVCAFSMFGKKYTEYFVQQLNFSLNDFNMWTTDNPVETDSNWFVFKIKVALLD